MLRRLLPLALLALSCSTSMPEALRQDDPGAAAEYAAMKRAGSDDVQASLRVARDAMRAMPRYSTERDVLTVRGARIQSDSDPQRAEAASLALSRWKFLGPGNIGGRTRVLQIDPTNPKIMYAGGVSGGIWKTETGGLHWTPIGDDLANIAINSLAMHPTDPLTLYAGTGEGYFREEVRGTGLPLRGNGIFVTRDGGMTWMQLGSTIGSDFHWVNDLVISNHDPSRLYAATRTGVWRSTNAGATWKSIHASGEKGGCLDLAYRSDTGGDFLFAACGTLSQATVYRSTDARNDSPWQPVLSEPDMGRTSLAIAPSNPSIVYAMAASNEPGMYDQGLLGVYRSSMNGDAGTWEPRVTNDSTHFLSTLLLTNVRTVRQPTCSSGSGNVTMGWYCNVIAVDPVNPDRVWAAGVDLFRSDDGGSTWGTASYWWTSRSKPSFVHADQHAIVFHPQYDGAGNRKAFFANDGGVYLTDDATAAVGTGPQAPCNADESSMKFVPLNHNFGVTQFYHGAVTPDGSAFIGGAQDNGTILGNFGSGTDSWETILGGDGSYLAIDPVDPNTIYAQTQYGAVYRSTDRGHSFRVVRSGQSDDYLFITPLAMDPNVPATLWMGGRRMLRTLNRASNWSLASLPLPGQVSAIAVAPGNSNHVLAGTTDGSISRSDAGTTSPPTATWPAVKPREGWVSWITFDPADANVVYATYAGFGGKHVWRSVDGGTSWSSIDANLPDLPVHSLAVDPTRRERLYLGTDLGVFVSLDGGASWAVENTGYANVVTETVIIGQGSLGPAVYAFTHGRGLWRAELTLRGPRRRAVR